jgi:hypothetical protein
LKQLGKFHQINVSLEYFLFLLDRFKFERLLWRLRRRRIFPGRLRVGFDRRPDFPPILGEDPVGPVVVAFFFFFGKVSSVEIAKFSLEVEVFLSGFVVEPSPEIG